MQREKGQVDTVQKPPPANALLTTRQAAEQLNYTTRALEDAAHNVTATLVGALRSILAELEAPQA